MHDDLLSIRDRCIVSHELFRVTKVYDPSLTEYILDLWKNSRVRFVDELSEFGSDAIASLTAALKSLEQDKDQPANNFGFSQLATPEKDDTPHATMTEEEGSLVLKRLLPEFLRGESMASSVWSEPAATAETAVFKSKHGELSKLAERSRKSLDESSKKVSKYMQVRAKARPPKKSRLTPIQNGDLPILQYQRDLVEAVKAHQVIVVIGETGSGKTTQIPQILMHNGFCDKGEMIACTQPRRVAATSVAKRVAEEVHCELGQIVGYSVRFDDKTSKSTRIKYMTDGMLNREALSDKMLSRYSVVILDEAHERTLSTDILFALIKSIIKTRPDLKLLITSATLDAQKFQDYFKSSAPVFSIPGRTFPVQISYAPSNVNDYVEASITSVLRLHESGQEGDILVFLTGQEEIDYVCARLEQIFRDKRDESLVVLPLYSSLSDEQQASVFAPAKPQQRKAVISTNIAETSITIDGIRFVIDSGFVKLKVYDGRTGIDALKVAPVSQAQATQRAGRAGRTAPGHCIRLYTKQAYEDEMLKSAIPEILRTNLSQTTLLLKAMKFDDVLNFDFLDPPPKLSVLRSLSELYQLGALDDHGDLTKLGSRMSQFPLEPAMTKTLIESSRTGCCDEILSIICMLGLQSVFVKPKQREKESTEAHRKFQSATGDHLTLLNIYQGFLRSGFDLKWCKQNFLQFRELQKAKHARAQIERVLFQNNIEIRSCNNNQSLILKGLCAGYFRNIATAHPPDKFITLIGNTEAMIHPSSVLKGQLPDVVLYNSLLTTSREYLTCVSAVNSKWLLEAAPNLYEQSFQSVGANKAIKPLHNKRLKGENDWRISAQKKHPRFDSNSFAK